MNYLSVAQTAEKWKMSPRRVQVLCNEGRIDGAQKVDKSWIIPQNALKPEDARKKITKGHGRKETPDTDITIERKWAMPNKNTFDIKPIRQLITEEMTDGLWIDPFANKNKLASVTNDISQEYDTDYHLDGLDFMKMFGDGSVDGVLYDPRFHHSR